MKYKDMSKSVLKSSLKTLKVSNALLSEIKYVAKCLRSKLQRNTHSVLASKNHDTQIQKNFWGYIKTTFKQNMSPSPTFDCSACTKLFANFFRSIFLSKSFKIPDWIPSHAQPSIPYDLRPPSYHQITKVVRRMKASGSPCPLGKVSIIPFKRCPYLRSYLTELFRIIWKSVNTPRAWKKACTILINKKGDPSDPANFRPITLETIPLKIFTSCMRDSMYAFLQRNGYIEHNIQKAFPPRLFGTFEYTAQLANVINTVRTKQRSLVVTLLDLKNAFGEATTTSYLKFLGIIIFLTI